MSAADNRAAAISAGNEEERRAAVISLKGNLDREGLKLLNVALGDKSWRVRKAAVEVFQEFPDRKRATAELMSALEDEDNAGRRNAAVEALVLMGSQAVPALLEAIGHKDPDVKKFLIDILGEIKDPRALDPIAPLTEDGQENIRLAAVEAIGSIGGEEGFNRLLALLSTQDVSMQFAVLHALSRMGRNIPVDRIKPLLDKRILRRAVYDALGSSESEEAATILADGLLDSTKSPRQAAVRSIDKLSKRPALKSIVEEAIKTRLTEGRTEPLVEMLEGNLGTRRAAVNVLGMAGTEEALSILIKAASDDSIRADVEKAVENIKKQAPVKAGKIIKQEASSVDNGIAEMLKKPPGEEKQLIGPMDNQLFYRLRDLVSEESGLYFDNELKYLVERRVQRRMEEIDLPDYSLYVDLVSQSSGMGEAERSELISSLSTNETYFFREEFQLRAFRDEILPEIINRKKKSDDKTVKIWSAGCSTGEEPYTIAIIMKEHPSLKNYKIEILGTDINKSTIDRARKGLYGPSSFRSTQDEYKTKYFVEHKKKWKLKDEIKDMVLFDRANLLAMNAKLRMNHFDVVFCRNVIIYFSNEAKKKAVDSFYRSLKHGGYLLLGHSESLMSISTRFELVHLKHDLVYRKPLEDSQ